MVSQFRGMRDSVVKTHWLMLILSVVASNQARGADDAPPVSERARRLHDSAVLIDGHNDLPWVIREKAAFSFDKHDISKRLDHDHTDIPRLREGGVKGQFW